MQALREIVRAISDGFRHSRDSRAGLLPQAANVVQSFGDRANANIGRARDIVDGGGRTRVGVLAPILAVGGSG
jgi:hypothetical protein